MNECVKFKKMLIVGLLASVITVILGELPIGWVEYPAIEGDTIGMVGMMLGSSRLSLLQLASGALFGGVCIPLQYYGFEGVAGIVGLGASKKTAKLIHVGAQATGFLGGIVHVICVAWMFICRVTMTADMVALPQSVMDFGMWLVIPISAVFMPLYYAMCISMFVVIVRGKTVLPKWAAVFNPLTGTLLINALPMILPASAAVNGLGMANMGIGSVLTFGGLLAVMNKHE